MAIKALVPDSPLRAEFDPLPAGVTLTAEPDPDVEFVLLTIELIPGAAELLAGLPRLAVVQSVFAGVDAILPLVPEGVAVCTASGVHDIAVSEWVVTMLLAQRRRLPELLAFQRAGHWERDINTLTATGPAALAPIEDLEGATILILGYGSIGRALARRLEPFGANIVGIARHARADAHPPEALEALLPTADAVVVLLSLTEETEGIVDADFLARMKPGALLVNPARGRHVDTAALLDALQSGHVRAALDVTDPEPLPDGHPLWSAPNVIITPHLAGGVVAFDRRAYHLAGEQLRRYAAGEPLRNVVQRP
jgi:phosphoglycerate dehydrogenase-like enzyme